MGGNDINILGEGGTRLCKGTILGTLGVMIAPVLALALAVATAVDGHFGCYLFCLNLHEKGSKYNHQSSRDWNDLEVA